MTDYDSETEQLITPEVIEALRSGNPIPPGIWFIPDDMAPIQMGRR